MSNLKRDIEMVVVDSLREFEDKKHRAFELLDQGKIPRPAQAVEAEHAKLTTTQIINLIESVVDKVIGGDEKEMVLVESEITVAKEHGYRTRIEKSEWFDEKIHARNKLRKEQRDIKSKLIGKE